MVRLGVESIQAHASSCTPGLAPCAILISSWSALTRNSGVTPKRPEATCNTQLRYSLGMARISLYWSGGSRWQLHVNSRM